MKFKITWFMAFGLFLAGMILIQGLARDAALMLLSYYCGGIVCTIINQERKPIPTLTNRV